MLTRRKMLGWIGALPLIGLTVKAETAAPQEEYVDRVFRNKTVRLPKGFCVHSCIFEKCRIITQDSYFVFVPLGERNTFDYGGDGNWRASRFVHCSFTDCVVGAE